MQAPGRAPGVPGRAVRFALLIRGCGRSVVSTAGTSQKNVACRLGGVNIVTLQQRPVSFGPVLCCLNVFAVGKYGLKQSFLMKTEMWE